MKLSNIKFISRDDLSKAGELPKWLDAFMQPLNDFIGKVGQALQGQLTFEDNFLCKVVKTDLTHATELEVNPYPTARSRSLRVTGVLVLGAGGGAVDAFRWVMKENGNIAVTVAFDGGLATTRQTCTLLVLLGG